MITKFKCAHCGENNPAQAKHYDGALGYEAVICQACGWAADHYGMHPPEAAELAKRVDWQTKQALICYAQNMYDFLRDLERYSGGAMEALAFIKGWVRGFRMKVNREGAELQKELAKYAITNAADNPGGTEKAQIERRDPGANTGLPETPGNRSLEKF